MLTFKTLWIFTKKCTAKPYSFLVVDVTLASGNPSRFRKNLLKKTQKLIITIAYKIKYAIVLQYAIHREAAKISALSSGRIDKCEYLTGEEILPPDQKEWWNKLSLHIRKVLEKALEKQTKMIEDQGIKQIIKAIQDNGKQLVKSIALVKKNFNFDRNNTTCRTYHLLKKVSWILEFRKKN